MEGVGGGASPAAASLDQWRQFSRLFQFYLDKTTPHAVYRWSGTAALVFLYVLRVYYVQGFYIVSYGLGIYILNLLIGFLSPLVDPELEPSDGPLLPTKGSDEFKPFIRRLPEFKFWYAITKAFIISFLMTFFSITDTSPSTLESRNTVGRNLQLAAAVVHVQTEAGGEGNGVIPNLPAPKRKEGERDDDVEETKKKMDLKMVIDGTCLSSRRKVCLGFEGGANIHLLYTCFVLMLYTLFNSSLADYEAFMSPLRLVSMEPLHQATKARKRMQMFCNSSRDDKTTKARKRLVSMEPLHQATKARKRMQMFCNSSRDDKTTVLRGANWSSVS
nr:protein RER1B-like [Tanacetum cinerariifolium]